MTKVLIPGALRAFTKNQSAVEISGKNVKEILGNFAEQFPDARRHIFDDKGNLRNFVNVFLNDEDVRFQQQERTPVNDADVISIVPAVAGGSGEPNTVTLSPEEVLRYSRHLVLPEVALAGQKKLKAASILIIGTGGLGSPLAMYLAAAGIGRLGLVDFDVVDSSNLQRQVIHSTANVGKPKLQSAKDFILGINPNVQVDTYETRFTSENAMKIAKPYDIVIDGTDNFPTRYLVNDVSVLLGKPNVYGSIYRFEGQASVFWAEKGPCYRCLYPEPPPPGLVPSCAEGGVLGVLPGIIGVIQANEAVKLILGIGEPLIGRLLLYDALGMSFREMKLRKDPKCPICGEKRTINQLIDYELFCGITPEAENGATNVKDEIRAKDLAVKLQRESIFLLDVREPEEFQIGSIPGATLIPLKTLPSRLAEVDGSREIIVYCRTGKRSAQAVELLRKSGYASAKNLRGGIHAWSDEVDPRIPKY